MRRLGAGLALILVAACGARGESRLESDLGAVSHVIDVPADAIEVVGTDVSGDATPSEQGQPRLDIIQVDVDSGTVVRPFDDTPSLPEPVRVVRDPLRHGSLAAVTEGAQRLVLLVIPLLASTRAGVDHDVRIVALDGEGQVIAADWPDGDVARLARLLEDSTQPAAALADAARAVAARALDRELTPEQRLILERLGG